MPVWFVAANLLLVCACVWIGSRALDTIRLLKRGVRPALPLLLLLVEVVGTLGAVSLLEARLLPPIEQNPEVNRQMAVTGGTALLWGVGLRFYLKLCCLGLTGTDAR